MRTLALFRPKKLLYGHYGDQKIKETFSGPLNIFTAICRRIPILSNMVIKRGLFKDKFLSLMKINLKNENF